MAAMRSMAPDVPTNIRLTPSVVTVQLPITVPLYEMDRVTVEQMEHLSFSGGDLFHTASL
jgi:hypothetical protein